MLGGSLMPAGGLLDPFCAGVAGMHYYEPWLVSRTAHTGIGRRRFIGPGARIPRHAPADGIGKVSGGWQWKGIRCDDPCTIPRRSHPTWPYPGCRSTASWHRRPDVTPVGATWHSWHIGDPASACCWRAESSQRTSITLGGIGRVDRRVGAAARRHLATAFKTLGDCRRQGILT